MITMEQIEQANKESEKIIIESNKLLKEWRIQKDETRTYIYYIAHKYLQDDTIING